MTILDYLQTHSLEEILENDIVIKEITYGLNDYWNPYLEEKGDNYDINVCVKHNCTYFREDTDTYEFFGHSCTLLEDAVSDCPYKDEHKSARMKDAKQILLKELES